MRSGFAAVVGRPNVGKSTLVNSIVGTKVSITSPRPNTTRHGVRGVLHRSDAQVVFVDTPGFHRPRSALGERLNETIGASLDDVDVVVAMVDATEPIGPGDRRVLARSLDAVAAAEAGLLVVVNKIDRPPPASTLERLAGAADTVDRFVEEGHGRGAAGGVEYFPVAARTCEGIGPLVDAIVARMPEGPAYYPADMVTDTPEALRVAELVREQLLRRTHDELPHAIACQVTEWDWPTVRCEIIVERDSQKAIVIGRRGEVLKAVGTAVRRELPPGAYLDLFVRVEKHWQQRADALDRLGY